jgi:hypothetical protein
MSPRNLSLSYLQIHNCPLLGIVNMQEAQHGMQFMHKQNLPLPVLEKGYNNP